MENIQKIIVVDDHEFFRKGVILTLRRFKNVQIIGEATNGEEFLKLLQIEIPDIVLMDIKMPEMDGITATQKTIEKFPTIKIIALTMFGEEEYLESMLNAGAFGFLLKSIDKEGLFRAIQAVSEGRNYFSEDLMPYFTNKYLRKTKQKENEVSLTKREIEILNLVSKGLTNKEIADKLFISLRTVTNHRAKLNIKTGSKNTVNLLSYAIRNNLIEL